VLPPTAAGGMGLGTVMVEVVGFVGEREEDRDN
jgi:hypothetical protein